MKNSGIAIRILTSAALVAGAVGCSSYGFPQVAVTSDASLVAGCEKVADVSVGSKIPDNEVLQDLTDEAGRKGANYVLLASDGARNGSAYRCSMPAAGASASTSGGH